MRLICVCARVCVVASHIWFASCPSLVRDGNLGVDEFVQAWSQIGNDIEKTEAFQMDVRYNLCVEPHRERITAMFRRLDVDGSGQLSVDEFKDLVLYVAEGEYDEADFLRWYDTSTDPKLRQDGLISAVEFGWWVADSAELEDGKMLSTMARIDEAITRTLFKKKTEIALVENASSGS